MTRPSPPANPVSAPYWDAARRRELVLQRCDACERYVFQPRSSCPFCAGRSLSWEPVSGRGTIYTFTVARRSPHPGFADRVPLVVGIVELAEGPRLTTNIVGCLPDMVRIGMAVEVEFEGLDDKNATVLPVFRPINAQEL